jgi:prepilin-type processing-associated H-X9-DG protein
MLNWLLNGGMADYVPPKVQAQRTKTKTAQLLDPPSARTFSFLDVCEHWIPDGCFVVLYPGHSDGQDQWNDIPSDRHAVGANVAFWDGHVERRRWLWPKKHKHLQPFGKAENDRDLQDLRWMQERLPGP